MELFSNLYAAAVVRQRSGSEKPFGKSGVLKFVAENAEVKAALEADHAELYSTDFQSWVKTSAPLLDISIEVRHSLMQKCLGENFRLSCCKCSCVAGQ